MDIKEQVKERLMQQNLIDLKGILKTTEGRRFFSWLLEQTGRDQQQFRGNSHDIFMAGMRNVSMMLVMCCKSLGLEGLDAMHKAEKEYIQLQMEIAAELKKKNKSSQ